MRMTEDRIKYEKGDYFVYQEAEGKYPYRVFKHTITHSESTEAYPELSLAIARVDYLARAK